MIDFDSEFELYTPAGNNLAAQLVGEIRADILEDRLTRKQAIARVQEAVKQIRAIDDGMADSEPLYAIWHPINQAFKTVGFVRYEP